MQGGLGVEPPKPLTYVLGWAPYKSKIHVHEGYASLPTDLKFFFRIFSRPSTSRVHFMKIAAVLRVGSIQDKNIGL